MIRNAQVPMRRRSFRRALAPLLCQAALVGGAGLALTAAPAMAAKKEPSGAPKITLSPKFAPVYSDLAKKIEADKARPDVVAAQQQVNAATDGNAQKAAQARLAALLTADRAQLATVQAAAVTPDDHYAVGELELELGGVSLDPPLQRQALQDILATGKNDPAQTGVFQFNIGNIDDQTGDYAGAITAFQAAQAAGYADNQLQVVLADAYLKSNQLDKGLATLLHAIDLQKASGQPVPLAWYRAGVVAAYNAKLVDPTLAFGAGLIQAEPTQQNWALLLEVVQSVGNYPAAEALDLLRLMGRTHSFAQRADYLEYIQAADPRRLPGEVLDVIAAGEASGMLSASEVTVAEAKSAAAARVAADRAGLPSQEQDARSASASANVATAAGDSALSYGKASEALAMYTIALNKPGVDTNRVLTRTGIAQIDTGDFTGAQATFAKITGPRVPIAKLWSIYAAQKAAGK